MSFKILTKPICSILKEFPEFERATEAKFWSPTAASDSTTSRARFLDSFGFPASKEIILDSLIFVEKQNTWR